MSLRRFIGAFAASLCGERPNASLRMMIRLGLRRYRNLGCEPCALFGQSESVCELSHRINSSVPLPELPRRGSSKFGHRIWSVCGKSVRSKSKELLIKKEQTRFCNAISIPEAKPKHEAGIAGCISRVARIRPPFYAVEITRVPLNASIPVRFCWNYVVDTGLNFA